MRKRYLLVVISILAITLTFSGCSNKSEDEPVAENVEVKTETDDSEGITNGIFTGDRMYDFTLKDIKGNKVSLSDFSGKVVFVNFWASWCPPCKSEMPHMQRVYKELQGDDFDMLTVNLTKAERNGKEGAHKFIEEKGYTFPVVFDEEGEVSDKFSITGIPTTYIINKEGIIISVIKAPLDEESIKREIEKAME